MKLLDPNTINRLALSSFSLIMATGIVSIGAYLHGYKLLAEVLYYLNLAMYFPLVGGLALRFIKHRNHFIDEFKSHTKGPGALTLVCGTAVLGSQVFLIGGAAHYALYFLIIAVFLWFFMTYGLLLIFTVKSEISLIKGLDGSWLLFIVASQSTSILMTNLIPEILPAEFLLLSVILFYSGILLYVILITLIMYRYVFMSLDVTQLNPPYWINMGAIAITVYSGSSLISKSSHLAFLHESAVVLSAITVAIWVFCVWWIPLIIGLGVWKYGVKKYPLKYNLNLWSMVFPIGMFSVCSYMITPVFQLGIIHDISFIFYVIALCTWVITFVGMIRYLTQKL